MRAGLRDGSSVEADRVSRQHHAVPVDSLQRHAQQSTAEDFSQTRRTRSHHLSGRRREVDVW